MTDRNPPADARAITARSARLPAPQLHHGVVPRGLRVSVWGIATDEEWGIALADVMGTQKASRRLVRGGWLLALALGCTTQPVGARCEQDRDCNSTNNEVCRSENAPGVACAGSSCICCPADPALAATIAACAPRSTGPTDAGSPTTDAN